MSDDAIEARLIQVESLLAQNQKTIEELNEVVIRQGEQIDLLKSEVEVLGRELLQQTEGEAGTYIKSAGEGGPE